MGSGHIAVHLCRQYPPRAAEGLIPRVVERRVLPGLLVPARVVVDREVVDVGGGSVGGVAAADRLDILNQSAKAAAAGVGDTGAIAFSTASAIRAYGDGVLSAQRATDVFTATIGNSNLTADELSSALGRLAPSAAALGIDISSVAGTMAALSQAGTPAEETVTGLNAVMKTLIEGSKASADALAAHGLTLEGLRTEAAGPGGLINVLRTVSDAFGDDEVAIAQVIPNIRALRVYFNLLTQDGASVDQTLSNVANSAGATQRALDAVRATPND